MDPVKRVSAGDPLAISAKTWNEVLEATAGHRGRRLGLSGSAQELNPVVTSTLVWVKNTTGDTIAERSVLTPSGVVIDPETDPLAASEYPVFLAASPSSLTDPALVTIEPIADGAVGRAVASGVAVVEVEVTDSNHKFATAKVGNLSRLESADCGPARILWPHGGGTSTRLVLLGAPPCNEDLIDDDPSDCPTGTDWPYGLLNTWCLQFSVVSASGQYSGIDTDQTAELRDGSTWTSQVWDDNTEAWIDWDFTYDGGSGPVAFWVDVDGPHLSINDFELALLCVTDGCAEFAHGPQLSGTLGTGTPPSEPCADNTLIVRVCCQCCSIDGWGGEGWYCVEASGESLDTYTLETGTDALLLEDGASLLTLESEGGGCVPEYLTPDDRCDGGIVICSGPYASESEAEAACAGDGISIDCCPGVWPETLCATFSEPGGGTGVWWPALVEVPLTWNGGTLKWEGSYCTVYGTYAVRIHCVDDEPVAWYLSHQQTNIACAAVEGDTGYTGECDRPLSITVERSSHTAGSCFNPAYRVVITEGECASPQDVSTWDCVMGSCVEVEGCGGEFFLQEDCEFECS